MSPRHLPPPDAARLLSTSRVVDVRSPAEFNDDLGHLPGAELLPLDRLEEAVDRWAPHERLVVVCRSGRRATAACFRLLEAGFRDVVNLDGGMLAWRDAGFPVCGQTHGVPAAAACGARP